MMDGYLTVSKEEAKRMIDAAPGDNVTIAIYNTSTMVHKPTLRKKKRISKEIIELAREIGYQDNDFFGVIGCLSNEKILGNDVMWCNVGFCCSLYKKYFRFC